MRQSIDTQRGSGKSYYESMDQCAASFGAEGQDLRKLCGNYAVRVGAKWWTDKDVVFPASNNFEEALAQHRRLFDADKSGWDEFMAMWVERILQVGRYMKQPVASAE